jgi:hypothetical protein
VALRAQLKLAAAAGGREKLPTYAPVPAADLNGHALNGRHGSFGENGTSRTSPRTGSLKKDAAVQS